MEETKQNTEDYMSSNTAQITKPISILRNMEQTIQSMWDKHKVFDSNPDKNQEKFLVTFPYPYMNGYLHLGHAFTITKADFRAGYERLQGKNVLFPFAFHCTGMPIAAAAQKIKEELNQFGSNGPPKPINNSKQKSILKKQHSKLAMKGNNTKYQWHIMNNFDVNYFTNQEIATFSDPYKWLQYFPWKAMEHLKQLGIKCDWRRSFITTDMNPYYNKFIEWQFIKLKKNNKIIFGKRPTIYSPKDNQPCLDHERMGDDNYKPQQYTLIKMEIIAQTTPYIEQNGDKLGKLFNIKHKAKIFMVAATLRPETMYGQTNCFVLPNGKYIAIETKNKNEIYICSQHSAMNMSYQCITNEFGKYNIILDNIKGWDLLGRLLKAPNSVYKNGVYVLPLNTIRMDKGTGIVTSVPSDAPADYNAFIKAKQDGKWRNKYYLTNEMVIPYDIVPIIYIDEFKSNQSAVDMFANKELFNKYKNKETEKNKSKLEIMKDIVYKYGFAQGVMTIGDFIDEKVWIAKEKCQKQLIERGLAEIYWEPEDTVFSRTGCKCVVAFCDQWFIEYGNKDKQWKNQVEKYIYNNLECYSSQTKNQFKSAVNWLSSWGCSRKFGLGTKLPWDKEWVIESLSDSTIYMAFYTIAHYIMNNSLDGNIKTNPINPNELTEEIFDCIFCDGNINEIDFNNKYKTLTKDLIFKMKLEFEYYYPMDLRVSGKELIPNHLTMSLYNHAAIWPHQSENKWPKSFFTNGWALLNNKKMSKSSGNFLTLKGSIDKYGADATRFALADGGDTNNNANIKEKCAKDAMSKLLKLQNFIQTIYKDMIDDIKCDIFRDDNSPFNEMDVLFNNLINRAINESNKAYKSMKFKEALKWCFHSLIKDCDFYKYYVNNGIHKKIIKKYIYVQLIILSPICPHITESIWGNIYGNNYKSDTMFCINASWPKSDKEDIIKTIQFNSLKKLSNKFREKFKKENGKEINGGIVCVADGYKKYQKDVLSILKEIYDEENNCIKIDNYIQYVMKVIMNNQKFSLSTFTKYPFPGGVVGKIIYVSTNPKKYIISKYLYNKFISNKSIYYCLIIPIIISLFNPKYILIAFIMVIILLIVYIKYIYNKIQSEIEIFVKTLKDWNVFEIEYKCNDESDKVNKVSVLSKYHQKCGVNSLIGYIPIGEKYKNKIVKQQDIQNVMFEGIIINEIDFNEYNDDEKYLESIKIGDRLTELGKYSQFRHISDVVEYFNEKQKQVQFAKYVATNIMEDRGKDTFNENLGYDEYDFLVNNKKILFHGIDVDHNKIIFYKESNQNVAQILKDRTKVCDPVIKFHH